MENQNIILNEKLQTLGNTKFTIFVNGRKITPEKIDPQWTLVYFLREQLGLRGSKIACGEGGCGACTVILSAFDAGSNRFRHVAINACITPLCYVYGCHILTVEGVSESNKTCHPIQDSIARHNGTQCGFCTPGMVMSMYALSANNDRDSAPQSGDCHTGIKAIKTALQGNLCRCTGYRPILDAFKDYCNSNCERKLEEVEDLCSPKLNASILMEHARTIKADHKEKLTAIENLIKCFDNGKPSEVIMFTGPNSLWLQPLSLEDAFRLVRKYPSAELISGSTELYRHLQNAHEQTVYINIERISELRAVERHEDEGHLTVGAALTITEMVQALQQEIQELPSWKTRSLRSIVKLMETYGSAQVRNSATIGGSLMSANIASDVQTFYLPFDCWAHRYDFETQTLLSKKARFPFQKTSVIKHLEIPYSLSTEYFWTEKVSKRKYCDVGILNAAAKITMDDTKNFVHCIVMCFGGIAVQRFQVDFVFERNQVRFTERLMDEVSKTVLQEVISKVKDPTTLSYISSLAKNLVLKFYHAITTEVQEGRHVVNSADENKFKSSQLFALEENGKRGDLIGKPIVHASAYKHAAGEAVYCDDVPPIEGELFMALVLSERAHANILHVDVSEALALDGVVGYLSHKDPVKNSFGIVVDDEEIFASSKVTCFGQIIGGVVAVNRLIARRATKLVKISYEDVLPLILTLEDAIEHASYYKDYGMKLTRKSEGISMDTCEKILEGEMRIGSQAHFYMETQGCIAIPKGEDDEMELISATQNPNDVQRKCAEAMGVLSNHVVVKVKRIGGGFGGKETRCLLVALPTAVAAKKFGKPVRCTLDRETDMIISGKRHTFLAKYKVGFSKRGRLLALQMTVYCDGGNTLDVSEAAIERALVNMDNAYNIPLFDLDGFVCKTNLASNTAFRGTGGPQAALIIEGILDRISVHLDLNPTEVRRLNMYAEGDVTPYGQMLTNCTVDKCWAECLRFSDYASRQQQVDEFNKKNKYLKRGLSVNPSHFGIAYTAVFLNQGAALVNIYMDGSVLIAHGGVEIGQGLHTKMIQVATRELGIDASKIRISETSTDKVPNPTPTSASSGSDLMGMAVMHACQELTKRLEPYRASGQNDWEASVSKAYFDRVSLSATGFFKVPRIGWNSEKHGSPFNYYSTGAACTEVELDCLTGQHKILRTDIVMDVGKSLNPAIDIGQIEGAFMHGIGFFTTEDLVFDAQGKLMTRGANMYKIPTFDSAPLEFNVAILPGSSNPHALYSSKAVGEPPLLLATSGFYAIKEAIRSYRRAEQINPDFPLNSPATVRKILTALTDASTT